MPDLQSADPESLRLELQEAIATFRHQVGLLIQVLGVVLTADSALIAYAFTQKKSGIFLAASMMPIATGIIYYAVITGLIPMAYVAIKLERKLSLGEEAFMTRWILARHDLPFRSIENIEDLDRPEIRHAVLESPPLYLLKDPKMLTLVGAFVIQLIVFIISLTVYHYALM
jgi:hypothetical protein